MAFYHNAMLSLLNSVLGKKVCILYEVNIYFSNFEIKVKLKHRLFFFFNFEMGKKVLLEYGGLYYFPSADFPGPVQT